MKLSPALAPQYWSALILAVLQQAVTGAFSALLLDGGVMLGYWCFTMLAFWTGVAVIIVRRPVSPARFDLEFITGGFIPLFVFTWCLNSSIWHFGFGGGI